MRAASDRSATFTPRDGNFRFLSLVLTPRNRPAVTFSILGKLFTFSSHTLVAVFSLYSRGRFAFPPFAANNTSFSGSKSATFFHQTFFFSFHARTFHTNCKSCLLFANHFSFLFFNHHNLGASARYLFLFRRRTNYRTRGAMHSGSLMVLIWKSMPVAGDTGDVRNCATVHRCAHRNCFYYRHNVTEKCCHCITRTRICLKREEQTENIH